MNDSQKNGWILSGCIWAAIVLCLDIVYIGKVKSEYDKLKLEQLKKNVVKSDSLKDSLVVAPWLKAQKQKGRQNVR